MFCYQCEQTAKGQGCSVQGVCGKTPEVAKLQDLLIKSLKVISVYGSRARKAGLTSNEVDRFIVEGLFTTVTNVNFDPQNISEIITKSAEIKEIAKALYLEAFNSKEEADLPDVVNFVPASTLEEQIIQAEEASIIKRKEKFGEDVTGLQELLTYGIKGAAAYADHARVLGYENPEIYEFFESALNLLAEGESDINKLVATNLKCGEVNLKTMELLDKANTQTYGHPEPTKVRITPIKGKAILVSGHDLKDLDALLKQTEGKGINIYTHGEMLPCCAYPELKKYKHLVGNYGGAWQDQQKEFAEFPGAILMTTNCIQEPKKYIGRIFTSGLVQWPGVMHISNQNFQPVIDSAFEAKGFEEDAEEKFITIGFARNAVLNVADKVIDAVKTGKIKHFFLVGGCDGAKSGRNYYTDFAQKAPDDTVILTLACGKFRFNKLEFGDIEGIPRLLDIGQCNDAYSAVQIAVALANAFKTDVNSLPLSMILSWYEQKAVAILLSLLYLGIKNIRLGPTLPAFVTPAVLKVLVENFNIMPTTTAEADLDTILK
ncbi:MAG: hydroxylamine reductase [bacterium]